VEAKILASQE